jgi:profilin
MSLNLISPIQYSSGILLAGKKYQFIRNEPGRSIYGKLGAGGCCVVKTNQCIIIAVYDDSVQPGQCTTVVEKLADYLIDVGY